MCALLGLALAATTAGARAVQVSASRVDRASARAFLADASTFVRISLAHRVQLKNATRAFIAHLESSCPGSLADAAPPIAEHAQGAPPSKEGSEGTPAQRTTSQTFLTVALGELEVTAYRPVRAPALAFAQELTRLHWTRSPVAGALAAFARSILAALALRPPDLCVDARASSAIAFTTAPPEATQFALAFRATNIVNEGRRLPELAHLVRPLLAGGDLDAFARVRRLLARAGPPLQIDDATVFRLLRTVFAPHR